MNKVFRLLSVIIIMSVMVSCHNQQYKQTISQQKTMIDSPNSELEQSTSPTLTIFVRSERKFYVFDRNLREVLTSFVVVTQRTGVKCDRSFYKTEDCVDSTKAAQLCGTCAVVKNKDGDIACTCEPDGRGGYEYQVSCDCEGGSGGTSGGGTNDLPVGEIVVL
jgi:hypothetical protein